MDIHEAISSACRKEDPVHMNEFPMTGRYWSITKFEDIMYVDKNHELFSSASGIALGPRIGLAPDPEELNFQLSRWIQARSSAGNRQWRCCTT
ncbi:MAG: hypothetical protein ACNYPE_02700 [Candidatus Azotimanducaceae bacterium WSBS_2022_MAG_OTU7]